MAGSLPELVSVINGPLGAQKLPQLPDRELAENFRNMFVKPVNPTLSNVPRDEQAEHGVYPVRTLWGFPGSLSDNRNNDRGAAFMPIHLMAQPIKGKKPKGT